MPAIREKMKRLLYRKDVNYLERRKGLPKIRLAEAGAVGEGVSRSSREEEKLSPSNFGGGLE